MTVEQVRRSLQDEGGRNDLFRLLEAEPCWWRPTSALAAYHDHGVGGFNKGEGDGMILPG